MRTVKTNELVAEEVFYFDFSNRSYNRVFEEEDTDDRCKKYKKETLNNFGDYYGIMIKENPCHFKDNLYYFKNIIENILRYFAFVILVIVPFGWISLFAGRTIER